MKKYLLVSLTILFAAAFVWAADAATAEPGVDIEADATLSWGFDLGSKAQPDFQHGFKNKASWGVKFPLLKKANKTSTKNDAPVYGEVDLKNVELNLVSEKDSGGHFSLDGKVDKLAAKLVIYGAYITVFNKPSFAANYAEIWEPVDTDQYIPERYRFKPSFGGYGTKIGYANKDLMDLDVGLKLGSSSNWAPDDASGIQHMKHFDGSTRLEEDEYIYIYEPDIDTWNWKQGGGKSTWNGDPLWFPPAGDYYFTRKNKEDAKVYRYGIGFDFSMKPLDKMLTLAFTVNSTFGKQYKKVNDGHLNFGFEVTSEPMDGLKLKAGFDGKYVFDLKSFNWDTIFTAGYKWVETGVYVGSAGTPIGGNTRIDMAVFAQFVTKADKEDATNLVEGLDAGVYVGMYKLLANLNVKQFPFFAKVWGAYTININDSMWIKPFANVWLETYHNSRPVGLAYNLGVTYSPVEKVEVTAKWSHGKINDDTHNGIIKKSVIDSEHKGRFVLSLKVSY
ncbi:phage sheath protein [Treponema medium]|uniref:major outer sheath protein Msp n=1 Tax=Treponema medium TaxID=58231 RepID=UPI00197CC713|nr:MSP porin [Treponema medium]QSH91980.1 phage sheath protein [Treponema medium]